MLRTALAIGAAILSTAVPAASPTAIPAASPTGTGWTPAPSEPWDRAAGVLCDFPVHAEPILDRVVRQTVGTNPDGSPASELYAGELVVRVTNTDSGRSFDADVSGSALVVYAADGGSTWYAVGPAMFGFREGAGNLPRGLWVLDGVYTVAFSATGYKTVTMLHGDEDDVCQRIA